MIAFYHGTSDSVIQRLCRTILHYDNSWFEKCVPASDEQIQQLENICSQYGYFVPKVYLDYLKVMGEKDGGLLEREWDGYTNPGISNILEMFCEEDFEGKEYLQRGFLLFSYHWTTTHCYLDVSRAEDNPVVTDRDKHYFAGTFEKYLFQKAFAMYQEKFKFQSSVGTSIHSCNRLLKKHSFPCSTYGGTAQEKIVFVRWLVKILDFPENETWFSDDIHYFSYNEKYALNVNIYHSLLLVFSCDDIRLKKKIDSKLNRIFS